MRSLNDIMFFVKDTVCTSGVNTIHRTGANVVTANRGPLAHPGPNIVPQQPQNPRPRQGVRSPLQYGAAVGREKKREMCALDIDDDDDDEEAAELPNLEIAWPLLRLRHHHHQSRGDAFHAFPLRPVVSAHAINRLTSRVFELNNAMDSA
jgi:hypothetical protein